MTIGERLVWHLQQQQKILGLPQLPNREDFQMRPINAQFKDPYKILTEKQKPAPNDMLPPENLSELKQQQYHHLMKQRDNNIGQYTQESNTVFYYDSYKVLILLDFSKSTSNIYPFQEKTYFEKMKESITIFICNLIFRLENKYSKSKNRSQNANLSKPSQNEKMMTSGFLPQRKSSHQDEQDSLKSMNLQFQNENKESNLKVKEAHGIQEDQNEQLSDDSPMRKPKRRGIESSTFKAQRPARNINNLNGSGQNQQSPVLNHEINQEKQDSLNEQEDQNLEEAHLKLAQSDSKKDTRRKKKESNIFSSSTQEPAFFEPQIYLTIAASGLPPSNQIRLMIHNQKVDDSTINEVIQSLESRLQLLEDCLAENYNEIDPMDVHFQQDGKNKSIKPREDYLQNHLFNALQILNLMNSNSKPLLVMMTDSTNSLLCRSPRGRLDPLIQKLHQNDTKIITVDLGAENKVANSFGYVNHMEHLKYLAYVSRGVYFDYSQLTKLAGTFNLNNMDAMRPRLMSNSYHSKGGRKDYSKLSKQNIKKSKFSHEFGSLLGAALGANTFSHKDSSKFNQFQMINYSQLNRNIGLLPDLSDNDRFHPYLNSLQKLMYSRPCSYSKFLQTSEIKELVNFEERMIFENRISGDLVKKMRKDGDLMINTSFCVRQLMLNNHYMPIFRKEHLSDYIIKCRNINQLCHSRSKMSFQFSKINFSKQPVENLDTINLNSKRTSRKNSSQDDSGLRGSAILVSNAQKVHYHHWWSSQILILCTIQQVDSRQVHVKYKIVAQEEVIHQLRVDAGQRRPHYEENDLQFIHSQLSQENIREINQAFRGQRQNSNDQGQEGKTKSDVSSHQVTLLEQLNNFIEHLRSMDKQHTLFEYLLLQADKGYEYILKRQLELPEKFRQDDFEDPYTSVDLQKQDEMKGQNNLAQIKVIAGKQYSGESQNDSMSEINKGLAASSSIPVDSNNPKYFELTPSNERNIAQQARDQAESIVNENSSDRFKQINKWPIKQTGSDILQNQESLDRSSQKLGKFSHLLHKTKSSDQHNFFQRSNLNNQSLPKQMKSTISEQEFQKLLFKNRARWQKLAQIPVHQWPQLFNYRKLDLLTHSNFKFDEIINLCSQMENQFNPDYQISNMVHSIMSKLTTFSIENGLYLQIFKENDQQKYQQDDAIIIKSSSGSGEREKVIRVRRHQPDSQEESKEKSLNRSRSRKQNSVSKPRSFSQSKMLRKNLQSKKDQEKLAKYGFCLVKVEWAAANLAVFHFGFYSVTFKVIQSFLSNFFTNDESNQERIEKYKKIFLEEVPDIQKQRQSFNVNDYKFYEKNLSQILIPEEDQDDFNFQICNHNKSRYDSDQSTRDYGNQINPDDDFHQPFKNQQNLKDQEHKLQPNENRLNANVPFEEIISNFANTESAGDRYYTQEFLNGRKKYRNPFTQQENVCYHKQWVWKNENRNTNKDFFEIIMKQRIKEGFYFLNRGCSTHKFLFIKALPAYKQRISKNNEKSQSSKMNMSFKKGGQSNKQSTSYLPAPDTYVLIQYVMYFDKDYEKEHRGQSCFKTEIYMEQESAYFYFHKQPQQIVGNTGGQSTINSVNSSVLGSRHLKGEDFTTASPLNSSLFEPIRGLSDNYTSVGEKNLFNDLFEYLQQVDSFLFNNVCTYHSIVKNSVQKLINAPEPPLIKGEVCYFKNLNIQQKKHRKRQKLELAIRSKMQLLKEDWNEFLLKEYPELKTDNQIKEESEYTNSVINSLPNSRMASQGPGKINIEDEGAFNYLSISASQRNKRGMKVHHQQNQQNERIMEEASFVIQIEELLENSKLIKIEQFDVPQIIFL